MPRTVDEGFRDFLTKLTPSPGESDAARKHRATIQASLKNKFGMTRFFRTGSFGNGTSISGYSDVDYFAVIPTRNLTKHSSSVLGNVRNTLAERFPTTSVRINCPAVYVPFGKLAKERTEVVPADFIKETEGYKIYDIPDCADGWTRSSPDAHNAYVRYHDRRLDGKLKPLIRFIKAWKFLRNVPVSSFYLELRTTKYASEEKSIIYSIDVKRVLTHLQNVSLARIQDPMGISGYIAPCDSRVTLDDALSKLATAVSRAEKALAAEQDERIKDAFGWWDLLFEGSFPGYYG